MLYANSYANRSLLLWPLLLLVTTAACYSQDRTAAGKPLATPPAAPTAGGPLERNDAATVAKLSDPIAESLRDEITTAKITQQLEEIESQGEIEEPIKAEIVKRYTSALEWLRIETEAKGKAASYQASIQDAPRLLANAKKTLAQPPAPAKLVVPKDANLSQIEQHASEADTRFKAAQESLSIAETDIQQRTTRKNEIAKLIDDTKQRLEETQNQLKSSRAEQSTPQNHSRRVELGARLLALESQVALYQTESARHDAMAEALPLLRDVAKREKNLSEQEATEWHAIVSSCRRRETSKQAIAAKQQVQSAHPALRSLAERNAALAEKRKTLANSIASIEGQAKDVEKQIEDLKHQYHKAEQRVRKAGHSTTVGLMLRRQKEDLPSVRDCKQTFGEIENEMPKANLAQIEIEEERESLGDIETVLPQLLHQLNAETEGNTTEQLEQTVRELLTAKLDLLSSLATDYETYLDDLSDLEISNRKLADQIATSSKYIREHVLWIRSAEPLGLSGFEKSGEALIALASPPSWLRVAKHCGLDTIERPLPAIGVILSLLLILAFHASLRAKAATFCVAKRGMMSIRPTLQSMALSAIVATKWPLLLAYLGWRMSYATDDGGLTSSLGAALLQSSLLLWASDFVRQVCRPKGLAVSHFEWPANAAKRLRQGVWWLTVLGIPMAIVAIVLRTFQNGEWSDSLGRIAFIAGMLVLAGFMHSIFNAKNSILRETIAKETGKWTSRLGKIAYGLGAGVPCLLAGLAAAGFYYSAQQLSLRWQATLCVSILLLFAYSLAARWSLVKRRGLAMSQARERLRQSTSNSRSSDPTASNSNASGLRPSNATPSSSTQPSSTAITPLIPIEDQQPDLSAIHTQLRYLLRHATIFGLVVCSWFIWSDVLPALNILDGVALWETTVNVTEVHEAPDGRLVRTTTEQPSVTTLRHALFAGLLIFSTLIIGRNLPALLEVTLLQRIPFDKGGRHAIAVLLEYSVVLAGVFLAFRTLSFTWASVQWLVAGMTVGLGFGLQEIFANFVSGLILLLERPIRVGDVITLSDVTGTVTDIKIRATTVTNWDRKELIVPNKDLITGRLLNWTLSDTTNRIVIAVGIAYESDPQAARELILNRVKSHPNVLTEPGPNVTFEEFADSALNLVIRAYVANMDVRLSTVHDLHTSIHETLRKAGIEIAFPQQDIHVRGIEGLPAIQPAETIREAA